jgi:DNA mismatch repair protein MutS2
MQTNIHKNEQVLQQIEWKIIYDKICDLTHFQSTRDQIFTYLDSQIDIEAKLLETLSLSNHLYENENKDFVDQILALNPKFNADQNLSKLSKGSQLDLKDINQFILAAEIFFDSYKINIKIFNEKFYLENYHHFKTKLIKSIIKPFRQFVSADGEINLGNHPQIKPLYLKQIELESKIRAKLEQILNSPSFEKKVQFNTIDIINDRYVIPIRSDSFSSSIGQIISRSESGNTLFVEPNIISQLNYQRLEIVIAIQEKMAKIERDLSDILRLYIPEFRTIFRMIYHIDEFKTRVEISNKLGLTYPEISDKKEILLKKAFHPLIPNPIKNDLNIFHDKNGIIISGPNTGGKTATLKTLALTQLFLRYGLFIPCAFGKIYLYDKTFYFGNDGQDLENGLSSFSAEVKNYTSLFENLGQSNLILIDEIFNSTSSEEASALAIAFFKKLHEISDTHLVVSSHHQTLKTILHQDNDYISAHVGFNTENNSPTYELHYGTPGSSQALKIFHAMTSEHALFKDVYENSLQFLDNQVIHYEKLLESLANKEHKLSKVLKENKEINEQLKNQKKSMEGVIRLKTQERIHKVETKLEKIMNQAHNLIKEVRQGNIQKPKKIDDFNYKLKHEIKSLEPTEKEKSTQEKYPNLSRPSKVLPNHEYFCLSLEKTVFVKKTDKKNAYIGIGNISMKVPLDSLRIANKSLSTKKQSMTETSSAITKVRQSQLEYDCRGMRLEEFQSQVQEIVSDLFLGEVPYVSIIHGHGTGVLKNWLRNYIQKHKDLAIIPNQSGNDGETRIRLI